MKQYDVFWKDRERKKETRERMIEKKIEREKKEENKSQIGKCKGDESSPE